MPQIINSFRQTENPLAKVFTNIGNSMFGDTLTPALNRQKLRAAERENASIDELARTFGGATDGMIDPNAASELAILAGMKPDDLAGHNVFLTGNKLGPRNAATTNAMAGAGNYKNSAENLDLDRGNAFRMNEADNNTSMANNAADNQFNAWKALIDPMDAIVNGQPGFVQKGEAAGLGKTGAYGAPAVQPSSYVDKVAGVESGGNPLAKNPNSSATGLGQFIDSTWLDMMNRHAPEMTQGKTPAEILALRNDPTLSRTMTDYLGQENGQALQSAGLPVTDGTKYLAHFAGAGGAVKTLRAAPGTPVASVLDADAMAANPFLQGMTTDQLVQWANSKVGGGASPSIAPIVPNASKPFETQVQEVLTGIDLLMPGATPEQKRQAAIGKLLKKGGMTVYDPSTGNPIMSTGDDPMDLTNANQTKMQAAELNARKFDSALNMASTLITNNPNSVGAQGVVRDYTQDVGIMAKNLADVLGVDAENVDASMAQIQRDASSRGLNLDFNYDPSIGKIGSLMKILAYQGAAAIGGQTGNDLSDKDFENIQAILGDPRSLFTNSQKMLGKLDQVGEYVDMQRRINLQAMGLPLPPPRKRIGDTTLGGNSPAPAPAGSAPPPGAAEEEWTIGPDGKPVRMN